jgi:hypothetical protein
VSSTLDAGRSCSPFALGGDLDHNAR